MKLYELRDNLLIGQIWQLSSCIIIVIIIVITYADQLKDIFLKRFHNQQMDLLLY